MVLRKSIFILLLINLALSFNSSFCMENNKEQTDCLICLQAAGNDQAIELPCCKKWFHVTCIRQWHKINPVCPHCKASVPSKIGNLTLSKNKKNNLKKNNTLDHRLYVIRLQVEEIAPFSRRVPLELAKVLTNLLINRIIPLYQRHPQHPEFTRIMPMLEQMLYDVERRQQQQMLYDIARERHRQEGLRQQQNKNLLEKNQIKKRNNKPKKQQNPKLSENKINNFLEDVIIKTALFSASTYLISSLVSKIFLTTLSTSMPMITFIWTIPLAWKICRNKGLVRTGKKFIRLPAKIVGLTS